MEYSQFEYLMFILDYILFVSKNCKLSVSFNALLVWYLSLSAADMAKT